MVADEDRDVVIYLITRSVDESEAADDQPLYGNPRGSAGHRPMIFECGCFDCYRIYWSRWDCSKDREAIDKVIEAYEEYLASLKKEEEMAIEAYEEYLAGMEKEEEMAIESYEEHLVSMEKLEEEIMMDELIDVVIDAYHASQEKEEEMAIESYEEYLASMEKEEEMATDDETIDMTIEAHEEYLPGLEEEIEAYAEHLVGLEKEMEVCGEYLAGLEKEIEESEEYLVSLEKEEEMASTDDEAETSLAVRGGKRWKWTGLGWGTFVCRVFSLWNPAT